MKVTAKYRNKKSIFSSHSGRANEKEKKIRYIQRRISSVLKYRNISQCTYSPESKGEKKICLKVASFDEKVLHILHIVRTRKMPQYHVSLSTLPRDFFSFTFRPVSFFFFFFFFILFATIPSLTFVFNYYVPVHA